MMKAKKAGPVVAARKLNPTYQKAWRSMRIMRQWSIPAIVCTIEGAHINSIAKFVASLERHAIVEKIPGFKAGRVGEYQQYRIYRKLVEEPTYPLTCPFCDQAIITKVCDPSLKQPAEQPKGRKGSAPLPESTPEEIEQAMAELWPKKETQRETERQTQTETPPLQAADYQGQEWHVLPDDLKRRLEEKLT